MTGGGPTLMLTLTWAVAISGTSPAASSSAPIMSLRIRVPPCGAWATSDPPKDNPRHIEDVPDISFDMSAPIRVHMRVPGTSPMPDLVALIQSIEAAGFDGAGVLDSQMISRDTFVVLGQAATHTARMTLFPAVTNPFTRHASVLASGIRTVEELAP